MTQPPNSTISAWFTGRLPDEWVTTAPPHITVDRDEITVTIELDAPKLGADASADDVSEAFAARMTGWREDTREHRMNIARHAEHRFERKVAWAVRCGDRLDRRSRTHCRRGADRHGGRSTLTRVGRVVRGPPPERQLTGAGLRNRRDHRPRQKAGLDRGRRLIGADDISNW